MNPCELMSALMALTDHQLLASIYMSLLTIEHELKQLHQQTTPPATEEPNR
jgi:hypothetical protein